MSKLAANHSYLHHSDDIILTTKITRMKQFSLFVMVLTLVPTSSFSPGRNVS